MIDNFVLPMRLTKSRLANKLILLLLILIGLEAANILLLKMLGINHTAYPWTFFEVIRYGFILFPIIAFAIVGVFFVACNLWFLCGEKRAIANQALMLWGGVILASWLAAYVFVLWEGINISVYPWTLYTLLLNIPKNSVAFRHLIVCIFGCYFLIAVAATFKLFSKKTKAEKVFGDAHFANPFEIKKAGLYDNTGIVLGKSYGKKIKLPGFESVLVVAPTGSGKTTSIAIPNLLEWMWSGVFNDLKGELYRLTAKFRESVFKNKCFLWAPANETKETHCYNPFFYVSANPDLRIRDIQLIAETLIPATKLGDAFWYQSSREIFLTLALYLFETKGMATLAEIHDLSKQGSFVPWLTKIIGKTKLSDALVRNITSLIEADEKAQKNIIKDFHSRTALFSDPIIRHATSSNDFDFRKLRKERISIYVNIPDSDKERLASVLTLFWMQLINEMSKKEPELEEEPYPVLALMDEFGNMARINKLKEGMSFLRAYRVRCITIVQDLGQIISTYGRDDAKGFINSKARIAYALTDLDDAKYFSEVLGKKTVQVSSRSVSTGQGDNSGSQSKSHSYQSRALMTPDELMRLNKHKEIILLEAQRPIKAKKCYWFKEGEYVSKLKNLKTLKNLEVNSHG